MPSSQPSRTPARSHSKLRLADFTEYTVSFRDYSGRHSERYALASDAMFRFQQLSAFPGIRDLQWMTARGYVFASHNASQLEMPL